MDLISRRSFLAITAAAGTVAAAGNESGPSKLFSSAREDEMARPGTWTHFATTCRECPAGCGMLARHRDGRITKVEGNPNSPVSRGGLCPRGQSAPQGLYDPDRVRGPYRVNGTQAAPVSWEEALKTIGALVEQAGDRIALISGLETGTLADVMEGFLASFGSSRILFHEPFNYGPIRAAHELLFGQGRIPQYRMDDCEMVLTFGADFLETWISPVEFAWQFGEFHSVRRNKTGSLVYVGPRLSMTAANADEFITVGPGQEQWVALAMVQVLIEMDLVKNDRDRVKTAAQALGAKEAAMWSPISKDRVRSLTRRFASAGNSIALASPVAARNSEPARNTAIAVALLNYAAGRHATNVDFSRAHAVSRTATERDTQRFLEAISPRDIIIIHNSNIAFTRPGAAAHLRRAKAVIDLTLLPDETSRLVSWVLPIDSPLESWGDYEPYTGVHSLSQPTMARLHDSRPSGDILIGMMRAAGHKPAWTKKGDRTISFQELLQQNWMRQHGVTSWAEALRNGGLVTKSPKVRVRLDASKLKPFRPLSPVASKNNLSLWLWPSIMLYDGRTANRGWMQESPEPVSYAAWSAWLDLHPKTAQAQGIQHGDLVTAATHEGEIKLPVRITEEVVPGVAAVVLGQGHFAPGLSMAEGIGANPFGLVEPGIADHWATVTLRRSGRHELPVYTSPTRSQYGRKILQTTKLSDLRGGTAKVAKITYPLAAGYTKVRDLYPSHPHRKHRWAMVVDLQRCIGCGACGVACYAENNIPVMGKKAVSDGREMAWLRIVPYRVSEKSSKLGWLPMLCQHCDAAPCEPVCPVYAAVHNEEGLNAQIYNRCIGTRYCSNNCPYKVRRFNWFNTTWRKPLDLQLNPEVTVRSRGVMEKCTFCVQRIREAEYRALREHRPVRDGEIQPACVQSCPTRVFTFGDLLDPKAEVTQLIQCDPRRYQVLHELNTKPAVIYLKKIVIDT